MCVHEFHIVIRIKSYSKSNDFFFLHFHQVWQRVIEFDDRLVIKVLIQLAFNGLLLEFWVIKKQPEMFPKHSFSISHSVVPWIRLKLKIAKTCFLWMVYFYHGYIFLNNHCFVLFTSWSAARISRGVLFSFEALLWASPSLIEMQGKYHN